ncbi:MAG TPA: PKD domain-containing protein [Bacteroidales bacterium]|nr:PKD domain-containing protein [Bacteroidales bacterium]
MKNKKFNWSTQTKKGLLAFKVITLSLIILGINSCKNDESLPEIAPKSMFTFSFDPNNTKIVHFQNASKYINQDTKYYWTFGDGDTSIIENPVHTYANNGAYQVVLKVSNSSYSDSYYLSVVVSDKAVDSTSLIPVVSFVYSQKGRSIQFQNSSSGIDENATFKWTFGDTTSSNAENPTHIYNADGFYSVVLKVTQNYKSYSYAKTIFISEAEIPAFDTLKPTASFSYYYQNNVVYFVNTSSNVTSNTKYTWNYGDGKPTENAENPNHTFVNGKYNVVLKVTNSKYTVTSTQTINVPALQSDYDWSKKPVARFVYTREGKGVYFQNASSNITPDTQYLWTFGTIENGLPATSTLENPYFVYSKPGTYSVVLKVTNANVSDSYPIEIVIP